MKSQINYQIYISILISDFLCQLEKQKICLVKFKKFKKL